MTVSIDQDEIVLQCKKIVNSESIKCIVTKSGVLRNMKLVNVRGAKKARPLITKKDYQIIKFVLEYQIDIIIVNYARQPETIKLIKKYIGKKVLRPIIFSGICTEEGLENIDEIIKESDGIIFSREFLSYELPDESRYRLLVIQKWVAAKCQQAGKPYYISGGIFQEALTNGNFIDNEISDITNALLDGATGFMLRDCPDVDMTLEVIRAMNELCCTVEPLMNTKINFWRVLEEIQMPINAAEACAMSCALVANQNKARVIVIPTVTGHTAKTLMWLRPASIVITVSSRTSTTRRLQSYRCVLPLMFKGGNFKNWHKAVEARVMFAIEYAVKMGWLDMGDSYVTLQRGSEGSAFCDMVRAWNVSIQKKTTVECPDETDDAKMKYMM